MIKTDINALIILVIISISVLVIRCSNNDYDDGKYPDIIPAECVITYDKYLELISIMENSKRLSKFKTDINQLKFIRQQSITNIISPFGERRPIAHIISNCKIVTVGLNVALEQAKRADSMTEQEFNEFYNRPRKAIENTIYNGRLF